MKPPKGVGEFMKKGINKLKNSLYFTHLPRSPRLTDLHQIWHGHKGHRRNHLYQFFGDRSRGVDSVGGRKLPSPIDKAGHREHRAGAAAKLNSV